MTANGVRVEEEFGWCGWVGGGEEDVEEEKRVGVGCCVGADNK